MKDEWDNFKFPSQPVRKYPPDWNRILSGVVAVVWLGLSAVGSGLQGVLTNMLAIALSMACIWFPDELSSLTTTLPGPLSNTPITKSSPGFLVRLFGWIALLVLTVVRVMIFVAMKP
jgi:hypothetical protein